MTRNVATAAALALAIVAFGAPAEAKDQKAFIREAVQGNLAEIEMGKLAQRRSTNEGVKSFGRMARGGPSCWRHRVRDSPRSNWVVQP